MYPNLAMAEYVNKMGANINRASVRFTYRGRHPAPRVLPHVFVPLVALLGNLHLRKQGRGTRIFGAARVELVVQGVIAEPRGFAHDSVCVPASF